MSKDTLLKMENLNEDLMDAVAENDKQRVLDVLAKHHNSSHVAHKLNVDEALCLSVSTQSIEIMKLLLNDGANVKYADINGRRALHIAVETCNVDIVKLILNEHCSVNIPNKEGKTPVCLAVECGSLELLQLLIYYGASISRPQSHHTGEYLVHIAAKKGFLLLIDELRSKGANLDVRAAHHRTPLHYAILNKQFAVVEYLCKQRVNVNAQDAHLDTPLAMALSHGLILVVPILLKYGARVDIPLRNYITVLHYIPSLMNKQSQQQNYDDIYQALMQRSGSCVNLQSQSGPPLHAAINANNVSAAALFLDYGADVNAEEDNGYTALQLAVGSNQRDMVALLLSRGAMLTGRRLTPSSEQFDGNVLHTLLLSQDLSTRRSKLEVLKLLLAAGCQVNLKDYRGYTPLDRLLYGTVPHTSRAEVAELVQSGVVLEDEIDSRGNFHGLLLRMRQQGHRQRLSSSLLLAAWHGDLDTANYLIDTSCVTCNSLQKQQWVTLPGRDDQSERFFAHCREIMSSPETLIRLCRISIREYLRQLTNDCDIRNRLELLPLPTMLHNFLRLNAETEFYLNNDFSIDTNTS